MHFPTVAKVSAYIDLPGISQVRKEDIIMKCDSVPWDLRAWNRQPVLPPVRTWIVAESSSRKCKFKIKKEKEQLVVILAKVNTEDIHCHGSICAGNKPNTRFHNTGVSPQCLRNVYFCNILHNLFLYILYIILESSSVNLRSPVLGISRSCDDLPDKALLLGGWIFKL